MTRTLHAPHSDLRARKKRRKSPVVQANSKVKFHIITSLKVVLTAVLMISDILESRFRLLAALLFS